MAIRIEEEEEIIKTPEDLYDDALRRMQQGGMIVQYAYKEENYRLTAEAFDSLGDLKDSKSLAEKCRELARQAHADGLETAYADAVRRMEAGGGDRWDKLAETFRDLKDYRDSKERYARCTEQLKRSESKRRIKRWVRVSVILILVGVLAYVAVSGGARYLLGYGYLKTEQYEQAIASFKKAGQFANAEKMVLKSTLLALEKAEEGTVVDYGDFRWKVLSQDRKADTILLIVSTLGTDNPLTSVRFNDEEGDTTWETSSLRSWLNGEILTEHFDDTQRSCIMERQSAASYNSQFGTSYGDAAGDFLSPLSAEEAAEYEEVVSTLGSDWWLRTPGEKMSTVCYITGHHVVIDYGLPANTDQISVRPVILVDLKKLAEVV